jgi:hypothetical protein
VLRPRSSQDNSGHATGPAAGMSMLDWFCLRFVSPFLSLLARSHNLQISKKHRRLFWVLTIHLAARTTRRTASTTMLSPDCRATALIFPPLTSISCPQVEKDLTQLSRLIASARVRQARPDFALMCIPGSPCCNRTGPRVHDDANLISTT